MTGTRTSLRVAALLWAAALCAGGCAAHARGVAASARIAVEAVTPPGLSATQTVSEEDGALVVRGTVRSGLRGALPTRGRVTISITGPDGTGLGERAVPYSRPTRSGPPSARVSRATFRAEFRPVPPPGSRLLLRHGAGPGE